MVLALQLVGTLSDHGSNSSRALFPVFGLMLGSFSNIHSRYLCGRNYSLIEHFARGSTDSTENKRRRFAFRNSCTMNRNKHLIDNGQGFGSAHSDDSQSSSGGGS